MSDRTMFIAVAFERHCKEHLNADFEVCKDEICQVAVEFEQAAQQHVQRTKATATAHPDCGDPGCCSANEGDGIPVRLCR